MSAAHPLNIVLTNDDGYSAPGIQILYTALVSAGFNVHIVAPAVNQSAQGSSLGGTAALSSPAAVTEFSPGNFYVDGRPATAVLTGLNVLFDGDQPDLVISGTNRGDNIGESENISGTVNGALQGLFEGVPSIAISAGSFNGSYDAAFANSANFMVDFLHELQTKQVAGQPILPTGEGLSINVPGNPSLAGVAVTTTTQESSASFPYAPNGTPNTFAEGFVPNTAPSGSPTSEGSQFLTNHITITPVDGNWGSTETDRDGLAVRLGASMSTSTQAAAPLNILLLNEDGHDAAGIAATRDALLAKGYNVTVLTPDTDQSGVGSALFLNPVTVTQYSANDYSANGTPASLVALALDPNGLFNGARPDLIVVGADKGDAVGIENANHSATLGGAITALFNYDIPSIAVSSKSGTSADFATSADFVANLIANLQATQGSASSILPEGVGLSVNVPTGASAGNYAFTTIDAATDANLSVSGNTSSVTFQQGGAVASSNPHSEGEAFNAGKITVSPIDGYTAVRDGDAYESLADIVGTTYGTPSQAPKTLSFTVSEDAYQGDARFVVTVNGHQIGGVQTVTASHANGQSQSVTLLDFFDDDISQVGVQFINDLDAGSPGSDRNLYVDKLTLDGQVFEGENAVNAAGTNTASEAVLDDTGSLIFLLSPGADTVASPFSFVLPDDAKNLTLTGLDDVNGAGNALANTLIGNDGANSLDGRGGADVIKGGAGNDLYTVDNAKDVIIEAPGDGMTDTVRSSVSYRLAYNVEKLALIGSGDINGTGNDLDNTLKGNGGDNILTGAGGHDVLTGGAGADTFLFRNLSDSTAASRDYIQDFSHAQHDTIDLHLLDADTQAVGNQTFAFIGSQAFTHHAGELQAKAYGSNTLVSADVNGDGRTDFAILLDGHLALQKGDFVL